MPGVKVPFNVDLPGVAEPVPAPNLEALTGKRLVNSFVQSAAEVQATSARKAERARATCTRKKAATSDANNNDEAAGKRAKLARESGTLPAGAEHLAAVMRWNAPSHLTLQQMVQLVQAADYYMAEAVLELLPTYMKPLLATAPVKAVCFNTCDP